MSEIQWTSENQLLFSFQKFSFLTLFFGFHTPYVFENQTQKFRHLLYYTPLSFSLFSSIFDLKLCRPFDVRRIELGHRGVQRGPLVQVQLLEERISRHRINGG